MEYSSYPTLSSAFHIKTQNNRPMCSAYTYKGEEISTHLASSINDLSGVFLALILDNLAEGILNRGVVAFHEMAVHELHRERGFPLSTISERDLGDSGMPREWEGQLTD
jgi:hypothetical protein